MKITKELLEELIVEVLEEEELDEVFGGVTRTLNRALGRGPRMQNKAGIGADTSALSGGGTVRGQVAKGATQQVLNQLRDILGDQSSTKRAEYLAQLMIDLNIQDEDIARLRSQIQSKMKKARDADVTRPGRHAEPRKDRSAALAAKAPPPVRRVAEGRRRRTIRIRRKK